MRHRWSIGLILSLGLMAGQPTRTQAWVLALDSRGGVVADLKPAEFQVKVGGKVRPLASAKTPMENATAFQSWVLVFEPIRDTGLRATAFIAAADFLTRVPEGDRVFIVARGKDSLESLMPGFSLSRSAWAAALSKVPDMLPESLVGMSKETLQGAGFQPDFKDASDTPGGQEALTALLTRFNTAAPGWSKGTNDLRGVNVLNRLNFDNPLFISGLTATVGRESRVLGTLLDALAGVPGQKHVIVFSRCESDDLSHPSVKRAMTQKFKREKGDLGGPAESATLANRDMILFQADLKARAAAAGVTVYSVAGTGQNIVGHIGTIAPATGGYPFPLAPGVDRQFGQAIQVFGSRYLLQWTEEGAPAAPAGLEITTTRKDIKLIVADQR